MQPVIPGTDVASLLHRRKLTGPLATRLIGREPLITFITFGELAKWAEIRRWGAHRRGELAGWLLRTGAPRWRQRPHRRAGRGCQTTSRPVPRGDGHPSGGSRPTWPARRK